MKIKWSWRLLGERALSVFKYLIAVYFIIAGLLTPWFAGVEATERLGWVYNSKWSLTILGLIIAGSGAWLLIGKIRKNRKQVGQGLMACFSCFLWAGMLNSVALSIFDWGNFLGALIMAALYLRWRFKTAYIDPNHFRDDVERLTYERHRLSP